MRRSWKGLVIGVLVFGSLIGGLIARSLFTQDEELPFMAVVLGAATLFAAWTFARAPRVIEVRERGIAVYALLRSEALIFWDDIAVGRVFIAPLGKKPHVVQLKSKAGLTLMLSDAEYHELLGLIDALVRHTHGVVRDERLR